ncbi:hypothetical protein GCM10010254_70390 [Streptomyces chromofuscus]|nr:hypothetical protein GCM10010254_70390 [Streptomyces chromofuscus]
MVRAAQPQRQRAAARDIGGATRGHRGPARHSLEGMSIMAVHDHPQPHPGFRGPPPRPRRTGAAPAPGGAAATATGAHFLAVLRLLTARPPSPAR